MVKRDDEMETSLGGVRDTDARPDQPGCDEAEDEGTRHEGRYKPEMGTIVVNEYPGSPTES
jgi:hypothetical protein